MLLVVVGLDSIQSIGKLLDAGEPAVELGAELGDDGEVFS